MHRQRYILGIDIGSGSIKGVAISATAEHLGTSQIYYQSFSLQQGYYEQNPEQIWQAFIACVLDITNKLLSYPLAISFSSVMHSVIPVNEQGIAIAPMLTWTDSRSGDIAESIRKQPLGEQIYNNTGTPIYSMSPLAKLIWLRENDRELFLRTHKFISIKEYIWYKLFKEYQVDYSIASATGLFNIETLCWDKEALNLAGIDETKLSTPLPTSYNRNDSLSETSNLLNILTDTRFVIGASDGCLANLGTLAIKPDTAAVTISTSGAIRVASNHPIQNYEAMTFSYILDEETFICGGPVNNGGMVLQWLLKSFLKRHVDTEGYLKLFEEVKTIPAGCEGLLFLPYLSGERAPVWDSKSCGTFFGVKTHHTQAHFSRAVIEGICFGLNEVITATEQTSGLLKQLHVSGGFISSAVWIQLLADITGKKLCMLHTDDASAVGAAYMGLKSLNIITSYDALSINFQNVIYPDMEKNGIYNKSFIIYKQLYDNLKGTMHQLYNLAN
ncbi:MAG: gluconokinase [Pyrinomonadaceae bacterium]|nr:gluconokinase [Sphingobacteriaceae bacterium]